MYNPPELIAEQDAPREVLYQIGVLIATAAGVDFDLGRQALRCVTGRGAEEYSDPLVAGMDFRVKLSIIRVAANRYPAEDCRRIQRICDKLQDLYQRRNDVAHLPIIERRGHSAVFIVTKRDARTGLPPPPKPFTASQIRRWAAHMEYWAIELDGCLSSLGIPDEPEDDE